MNRRERRAFQKQWETQRNEERNGAPVPPEIAARMTKPKPDQLLYQVLVDDIDDDGVNRGLLPVFPAVIKPAAEMFAEAVNRQVLLGKLRSMRNAHIVPCTPLQGVN